jgi:hypothetical protein
MILYPLDRHLLVTHPHILSLAAAGVPGISLIANHLLSPVWYIP